LQKIKDVAARIAQSNNEIRLEVDGGISPKTIAAVHQAGADTFVSATAIFKHPQGISGGVGELQKALLK
jgi:ribulose-phosphate 3-epimerase